MIFSKFKRYRGCCPAAAGDWFRTRLNGLLSSVLQSPLHGAMMYNEDPEDDEEQDELRRQLGDRYDIQEMIGRGACGVVYKAFDREEARVVALKRMHYHDIDVNGIPPHIIREVTALRSLMHIANENIVR